MRLQVPKGTRVGLSKLDSTPWSQQDVWFMHASRGAAWERVGGTCQVPLFEGVAFGRFRRQPLARGVKADVVSLNATITAVTTVCPQTVSRSQLRWGIHSSESAATYLRTQAPAKCVVVARSPTSQLKTLTPLTGIPSVCP